MQLHTLRARYARGVTAAFLAVAAGLPMKPRDSPAADMRKTSMPKPQLKLPGRKPTHRLFRVLGDGDAASWTPIGAAWPNKDGHGFNISCDAVPLQGRIVMREISAREQLDGGQQ